MKVLLIARMKSYIQAPPEEHVWDFGQDFELAVKTLARWTVDMAEGLWQFREWGSTGSVTLIKPGGISELDLRVVGDRL